MVVLATKHRNHSWPGKMTDLVDFVQNFRTLMSDEVNVSFGFRKSKQDEAITLKLFYHKN